MNDAHAEAIKARTQERNQADRDRDRATLKIEQITNGYLVKSWPKQLAFKSLDDAVAYVYLHFGHRKGAP